MKFQQKIILGSKSPRRTELLQHICNNIEVRTQDVEELYPPDLPLTEVPVYLAQLKASALVTDLKPGEILLTADTVVILENEILGKPEDQLHSEEMLQKLSGKKHLVVSGCTLQTLTKKIQFSETTEVYFKKLEASDITFYVNEFKPFDKAGSYGIQEWIGMIGIEKINGCYYNVMGLPVSALYHQLKNF